MKKLFLLTLFLSAGIFFSEEIENYICFCEGYELSDKFIERINISGLEDSMDQFKKTLLSCAERKEALFLDIDLKNDLMTVNLEQLDVYREPRKAGDWKGDLFATSSNAAFRIVGSKCNEDCFHDEYIFNLDKKKLFVNSNTIAGYVEVGTNFYSCKEK